jgi:hypothetical protein
MAVEIKADISTRPLILAEYPVALRKDNQTIEQDAARGSAILYSRTLMAKKQVDSAITPVAAGAGEAGANTGNGTCTLATVVGLNSLGERQIPQAGTWKFILTGALIGKLQDPSGVDVITGIALNDGTTTVVKYAGLQFTITDGATPFIATDAFALPVVANGKWVPWKASGVLGEAIPAGIYDPEQFLGNIAAATLIAGDVEDAPILIAGARFDSALIVIENSGALTDGVPGTGLTVEEYLRKVGLIAESAIAGSAYEND